MEKLKLKIQYFASTNQTTHYNLSQYIATDKPTYLIDYNGDMLKIDNAIYAVDSRSLENASNIGTMSNLNTTDKSSLVNAINEINTQLGINTSNISTNTSNIATLGTNQGDLINLMTTAKNNLVSAINELKGVNDTQTNNIADNTARIENFNLTSYDDLTFTTQSGTVDTQNMKIAYNQDKSLAKIYGDLRVTYDTTNVNNVLTASSPLRPTSPVTVIGFLKMNQDNSGNVVGANSQSFTIGTDGTITIPLSLTTSNNANRCRAIFAPCLIFVKDFGDVPTPEV